MSNHILAMVSFENITLKAEDRQINTWHFELQASPPSAASLAAISAALFTFYGALKGNFPNAIHTGNYTVTYYNMADPKPRSPITSTFHTLTPIGTGFAMPPEVSICLSYKAIPVSGVKASSRKGRIYLPSFVTLAYVNTGYLGTSTAVAIAAAANALLTTSTAAADWKWSQYSRVRDALAPVSAGWVDNAPDIQRRRGYKTSTRALFP